MTCAYQLAKHGFVVDVFESGDEVGGMSKTIKLWNQKVDLGPHRFFSDDSRVNELWLEVVQDDYEMIDRLTRIFYKGRFFYYPLKAFDALLNLGYIEAARCFFSYLKEKILPINQDGSFENWVVSRFGRRLYEHFFKTYTEKLWGISCKELDSDFADQRIRGLSLYEALKNALTGGKNNRHKTLVDQFAYPNGGTGTVYKKMAIQIENRKGRIFYNSPVKRVVNDEDKAVAVQLNSGDIYEYDHIVSTMPITNLILGFSGVPDNILDLCHQLYYRNTILVYLKVDHPDLFRDNWLYIHSAELQTGRMTNFQNWTATKSTRHDHTILAQEYWCYDGDTIWTLDDSDLIEKAIDELRLTTLSKEARILDGYVHRIGRAYPVYFHGYKKIIKEIEAYLDGMDCLTVIGRNGSFKYNNQDHSILMGILAAENLIGHANHNLWEINVDTEYQEKAIITKTGLGPRKK